MLARLFNSQLPPWARPTYPLMRYAIGYSPITRRQLISRFFLVAFLVMILFAVSYVYNVTIQETGEQASYRNLLYYPLVAATLLMQLLALALTTNFMALERQKGTWESLQITVVGAQMAIRTRWAMVFYRLRWLLGGLIVARLGYIALLMADMTDFEGRAIDVRIIGISPEVSLEMAVFLLAALMTAAILQPIVAIAFDAALGILVATMTRSRGLGILTTVILMGFRLITSFSALLLGREILQAHGTTPQIIEMSSTEAWARLLFLSNQGDLSLRLLNLESLGNIWADVDEGIYLGGAVLALVLVQAILANLMVLFAARRASKPSKV